jgi:hypothetical protein
MEPRQDSIAWENKSLRLDESLDDLKLAEAIRDSLSLMGWPLPWEMWRDSAALHFAMEQPAKRYFITHTFASNTTRIVANNKGFWRVFNSLHGAGYVPNGSFTTLWHWYTGITVMVGILSIITGLYIWITSKEEKKWGLIMLGLSIAVTFGWMIKIYYWG